MERLKERLLIAKRAVKTLSDILKEGTLSDVERDANEIASRLKKHHEVLQHWLNFIDSKVLLL